METLIRTFRAKNRHGRVLLVEEYQHFDLTRETGGSLSEIVRGDTSLRLRDGRGARFVDGKTLAIEGGERLDLL